MKSKKQRKENNHKLIYVSIISVFVLLSVTILTLNNTSLDNLTGYVIKNTEKPTVISSQIIEDENGNKILSLKLFDNNGINKIVVIYSTKDENGKEKMNSIATTKTNQLLKFDKLTSAGSYYTAKIPLAEVEQGSRLFIVVSDSDNNRENKLLLVE